MQSNNNALIHTGRGVHNVAQAMNVSQSSRQKWYGSLVAVSSSDCEVVGFGGARVSIACVACPSTKAEWHHWHFTEPLFWTSIKWAKCLCNRSVLHSIAQCLKSSIARWCILDWAWSLRWRRPKIYRACDKGCIVVLNTTKPILIMDAHS